VHVNGREFGSVLMPSTQKLLLRAFWRYTRVFGLHTGEMHAGDIHAGGIHEWDEKMLARRQASKHARRQIYI
jgi:hypothetical protein